MLTFPSLSSEGGQARQVRRRGKERGRGRRRGIKRERKVNGERLMMRGSVRGEDDSYKELQGKEML